MITATRREGAFASTDGLPLGGGLQLIAEYAATSLSLVATNARLGVPLILKCEPVGSRLLLSWPEVYSNARIEFSDEFGSGLWTTLAISGANTLTIDPTNRHRFFRAAAP